MFDSDASNNIFIFECTVEILMSQVSPGNSPTEIVWRSAVFNVPYRLHLDVRQALQQTQ